MASAVLATNNPRVSRKTWHLPKSAKTGRLTKTQKRLIRESFKTIEPASDLAAQLFYLRLYQLDPSLQALFKGRRKAQRRRRHPTCTARMGWARRHWQHLARPATRRTARSRPMPMPTSPCLRTRAPTSRYRPTPRVMSRFLP